MPFEDVLKQYATWISAIALGGTAWWAFNNKTVLGLAIPDWAIVIAMGVMGYLFHLLRKEFRALAAERAVRPQHPIDTQNSPPPREYSPRREDYQKGTPFSMDFNRGDR